MAQEHQQATPTCHTAPAHTCRVMPSPCCRSVSVLVRQMQLSCSPASPASKSSDTQPGLQVLLVEPLPASTAQEQARKTNR